MNNIPAEFILIFLGMVFIAVFLLSQGVVVPVFGEAGKMRKRIRGRLHVLEKACSGFAARTANESRTFTSQSQSNDHDRQRP